MAKPLRRRYDPLPLSPAALARIDGVARAHGGARSTAALAEAVASLSQLYTRDRANMAQASQKDALAARIAFFLPRDLPKIFGPLDALRSRAMFPQRETLRVLDVGAGLGATSLGLARWLRLRGLPTRALEIVALEQNGPALRVFSELAHALAPLHEEFAPLTLTPRAGDLRAVRAAGPFDLVLFGFVLNELFLDQPAEARIEARADVLRRAASELREGGALLVLEPALRETARELMQLRDLLVAPRVAPFVAAPCLHAAPCPMLPSERDWCHQELPYALPPALADVARAASLRYEGLSYASLVLTNVAAEGVAPGVVRVVSDRLETKGKLELFGCSETGYTRFTRLARDASPANEAFDKARRGDVLAIEGAGTRIDASTRVTER